MLRVLCLPGFRQSAASLSAMCSALRAAAAGTTTDTTGRLLADGSRGGGGDSSGGDSSSGAAAVDWVFTEAQRIDGKRCWWDSTDDDPPHYRGCAQSLATLAARWESEGPFDGVLGFSQGAAIASVMASDHGALDRFPGLRFAVLIGGFVPRDPAVLVRPRPDVRSLHVMGAADDVVSPDRSRDLAAVYTGPEQLHHAGGHAVPSEPAAVAAVVRFCGAAAAAMTEQQQPA